MSRLTANTHYQCHTFLRRLWLTHDVLFSVLSVSAQQQLHDFYRPAVELTPQELQAHRKVVTTREPSLPNRAGKHYRRIRTQYRQGLSHSIARTATSQVVSPPILLGAEPSPSMKVVVHPIARPEPDLDQIVLAILATLDHPSND